MKCTNPEAIVLAKEIPSHIYAALFLTAMDCDLNATFAQAIDRVEEFERSTCRFGSSESDMRSSAFGLLLQSGQFDDCGIDRALETLMEMGLRDFLALVLSYESVYCNDEGEYWEGVAGEPATDLRAFLARLPAPKPEETLQYLQGRGLDRDGLRAWAERSLY